MGGKNGGWRGNLSHQQSGVDRWETCQLALAEAQSQNVLLQKQLHECQTELRTVQRQCKLQSARLNKAIGHEADLPRIVDRLTADVRSLQIRLREKTNQCEAGQRKIKELQHRIFVLERELEEKQNIVVPDDLILKKQASRIEELRAELDREKKKVVSMQHQLEVTNRSHKHRLGLAQDRIRQLKRSSRELEGQLVERTQVLQEKIKLLELHNIYSQRLPKSIPVHLPSSELSQEQDLYTAEIEVTANSETQETHSSKILSLKSQIGKGRLKLNFGRQRKRRSDVSNDLSKRNECYVEEKHTNQQSDAMLCFNEVACEEANSKTMESVTDTSAMAPPADTGPASSEQYSDVDQSASTDIVRKKVRIVECSLVLCIKPFLGNLTHQLHGSHPFMQTLRNSTLDSFPTILVYNFLVQST
ncbi:unnamed protein product [Dicrocoelium dendriticum]|nr:unnamed protein product [Dicrocoelium dendriticum]